MNPNLRLLIVEDSKEDAELLVDAVRRSGFIVEFDLVDSAIAMQSALENKVWDVITSDHNMPQFNAPDALALAKKIQPEVPFIIISGQMDINLVATLMKSGASDYINKWEMARVVPAIMRELNEVEVRRQAKLAEMALITSESKYRSFVEQATEGFALIDEEGVIIEWNKGYELTTGFKRQEMVGHTMWEIAYKLQPQEGQSIDQNKAIKEALWDALKTGKASFLNTPLEFNIKDANGDLKTLQQAIFTIRTDKGYMLGSISGDITERKLVERILLSSEERFREIFENMSSGVIVYQAVNGGEDFRISLFNHGAEIIEKISREEVLGKMVCKVFPGIKAFGLFDVLVRVWKSGVPERFPTSFYEDERIMGWRENYLTRLSSGEVLSVYDNVSERKQAEESLRQSEERFRRLVETVTDYIYTVTIKDGRAVYTEHGPGCFNVTGFTPKEYADDPYLWFRMIYDEDRLPVTQRAAQAAKGQSVLPLEHRIIHKDGSIHWVRNTLVLRYDSQGLVAAYDGLIVDITEKKRAEEALIALNADLEQRVIKRTAQLETSNKELEAFAYSVSHDLRSPLRTIDGFSLALLEEAGDSLSPKSRNYLERMHSSVRRMSLLIDNLLKLSRITQSELISSQVNLSNIVSRLANELMDSQPKRKVEWIIAANVFANGDERLLEVALENLLSNAFKFTAHCPDGQIEFGLQKNDDQKIYFVRDNGAGFNMAYADKLFGVFQRLHTSHDYEGTGIGLATVKRIIQRHGGQVWAQGEVDKGATFYFTLA